MIQRMLLWIAVFAVYGCLSVLAQTPKGADSPAGYWKIIDDKTGAVRSIAYIWIEGDELKGKLAKLILKPSDPPNPTCDKCPAEFKGKPVLGLTFMWGFQRHDDQWIDGKILEADTGRIYNCQLRLLPGGAKLDIFGYVKLIFKVGRHQTWQRADETSSLNRP